MNLSKPAEEALVRLWEQASATGTLGRRAGELGLAPDDPALAELVRHGLVGRQEDRVEFTRQGWSTAARTARCHRLADLQPGQAGRVACVDISQPLALRKLMAMGVLPGGAIRLVRRSPAFVFRVGYSEFAVDETVAGAIYVRMDEKEVPAGNAAPSQEAGRRWRLRRMRVESCTP